MEHRLCKISSHLHCLVFFGQGLLCFSGRQSVMLGKLAKITNIAKLKNCNVLYSARKILYILPDFFTEKMLGNCSPSPPIMPMGHHQSVMTGAHIAVSLCGIYTFYTGVDRIFCWFRGLSTKPDSRPAGLGV